MSSPQLGFDIDAEETPQADELKAPAEPVEIKTPKQPMVYSISDINSLIRETLEGQFTPVWVRGEISNFKPHTSGHHYFSLKDDNAQMSAVMFKGHNSKLKFKPENGLEVLVRGKITVYEPRGTYQVFCEHMEPVGAGALQKAFEQLKAKLQTEGLFELKRKRALPAFPKHIGLVTSPTGAAIRDILNVLRRRYKSARITLAPALVQGETAPASIVAALALMNRLQDVDVVIIGRGGGSAEDLWAFNDERVARAIAASRIPTISAVGHEVDFTIADFVADLRAPTPSAAAELVVKSSDEVSHRIHTAKQRLWRALQNKMQQWNEKIYTLSKRLIDPQRTLQDLHMRNDELASRLEAAAFRYVEDRRRHILFAVQKMGSPLEMVKRLRQQVHMYAVQVAAGVQKRLDKQTARLTKACAQLDAMSPLKVVARGYSIVENKQGTVIKRAQDVRVNDELKITLAEGELRAEVKEIKV